ncbi:MAG: HAMP domain-containing histidine kinase [Candidatus Eremiobacteraeota bacterium]|nr:HAMP domain-containing histidine kinase [Candidatus Eremiobacteraeota bacterium]
MRNRLRALWLWWSFSALLMLSLWALSLHERAQILRSNRQIALQANLRELESRFAALDDLPRVLLSSLQQQPERLAELQNRALPFASLQKNSPAWAVQMAQERQEGEELVVLRPLPPGYELKSIPLETPPLYLAYCLRRQQDWYICELDLDYLFRKWLPEHLKRFELSGLRWELSERAGLSTLLAGAQPPFPQYLEVHLEDRMLLQENLAMHLTGLIAILLVLGSSAASIRLAARGIAKELEFTEARGRFMNMASHELRTPIATIKMYADILQHASQPDKLEQYHRVIGRQADRLHHLVENLLEAGALERGQRTFHLQELNLNELVEEAVAHAEGSPVQLELASDLPHVQADRTATLQVLANLIHNGQRYAQQLQIRTQPNQIIVSDRGPGIRDKKRVFEPYQRDSQEKGFGLGLSVVRSFMQGQGGRVELDDNPGGGSRFTLTFA